MPVACGLYPLFPHQLIFHVYQPIVSPCNAPNGHIKLLYLHKDLPQWQQQSSRQLQQNPSYLISILSCWYFVKHVHLVNNLPRWCDNFKDGGCAAANNSGLFQNNFQGTESQGEGSVWNLFPKQMIPLHCHKILTA